MELLRQQSRGGRECKVERREGESLWPEGCDSKWQIRRKHKEAESEGLMHRTVESCQYCAQGVETGGCTAEWMFSSWIRTCMPQKPPNNPRSTQKEIRK